MPDVEAGNAVVAIAPGFTLEGCGLESLPHSLATDPAT